ncbi:heparan-alpha-glucosaminide N-acetyltransferase domain-containing protein [Novosphingobium sp. BL-8H]|uniref:DUF1624 domain-containing protein n=1 Tax=Novosphingobium sp. BL-8H TaxID=3127640 RepID=UPI0037578539
MNRPEAQSLTSPELSRAVARPRIVAIDALRGLVMLLMLVDHTREFFYLDRQVSDPMDLTATDPALFLTRLAAHLCAPVFVVLTGVSAWLHARGDARRASAFLAKRGLFLIALEVTLVNFAWTFDPTPKTYFLQVIWAIGLSMLVLAVLIHLPRGWIAGIGGALVLGHNLLDPFALAPGAPGHALWAIVHQRDLIVLPWGAAARTSYPVLPWIGTMALGYTAGPWFGRDADPHARGRALLLAAAGSLALFGVFRAAVGYGDTQSWQATGNAARDAMAFVNLTKYPASACFLLLTLAIGALLLHLFERTDAEGRSRPIRWLAVLGGAPLFFYLLHLYVLHAANRIAGAALGAPGLLSVPSVGWIWTLAALVAVPCWFATRRFGAAKRASSAWWMRYL